MPGVPRDGRGRASPRCDASRLLRVRRPPGRRGCRHLARACLGCARRPARPRLRRRPTRPTRRARRFLVDRGRRSPARRSLRRSSPGRSRGRQPARASRPTRRLLRLPVVARRRARRRRGRGHRHRAVAHANERLLPDRHRARASPPSTRPSGGCASTGWSTSELTLTYQRPARPAADRGLGDAVLRLQRGRRRPDRQRVLERRPRRRPARRGRRAARTPTRCCRPRDDGWNCGTPLEALTDDRDAMLAIAMNGEPLPVEHGFPVRMVVPGLYGYVSATKWVVDLEVTRFDDVHGLLDRARLVRAGPGQDPVADRRTRATAPTSRPAPVRVGGVRLGAAHRHRAGRGPARRQRLAAGRARPGPGRRHLGAVGGHGRRSARATHTLAVRATDTVGLHPDRGRAADVVPDGATGWHTVEFEAG